MAIRKIISRSIGVDVIAAEDLAAGSVQTAEIQNGAVTGPKLADNLNYDSGTLYLDSTNNRVGIGTTSPGQPLQIETTSNAKVRLAYDATRYGEVGRKSNGNYEFSSYEDGAPILFGTVSGSSGSTNERMRIGPNGAVAIGNQYDAGANGFSLQTAEDIRLHTAQSTKRRIVGWTEGSGAYTVGVSGGCAVVFDRKSDNSDELAFETHYAGNYHREHMRLDKFGNHTVPWQPAFWAYRSGNWTGWTPNNQTQVVPFNAEYHDIGGHFNTSNGLFTCPVAGEYIFTVGVYVGVTSVEQIWLVKSGARSITIGFPNNGTTGDRIVGSIVIRCSANDTIGVCPYANSSTTSTVFDNFHHTFFLGALIN